MKPAALPRALAIVVVLISLSMLVPIGIAVARLLRREAVASTAWLIPLVILATGLALMSFLPRMQAVGPHLYLMAFALWVVAAGYFLIAF